MNKLLLVVLFALTLAWSVHPSGKEAEPAVNPAHPTDSATQASPVSGARNFYDSLEMASPLRYEAFEQAFAGYQTLPAANKDRLTVIDFTLPSSEKRMYVLDMKNKKLLFHTHVAHGKNSGGKYATQFSNQHGSLQSSLGFYVTHTTYQGANGYSLRLKGLEPGINDQAMARAVVIHGADYCSENVIRTTGRLGRSYGCPALPQEWNRPVIDAIKNGSLLFIYADDRSYLAKSPVLKDNAEYPPKPVVAQTNMGSGSRI